MPNEPKQRLSPAAADAIMAVATATAFLGVAATSPEEAVRTVDVVSVGFALLLGGALLVRRRWPLGVFVYSIVLITVYMGLDYPAVGLAFPLAASLYTAAAYGRAVSAAAVAGIALFVGLVWRVTIEPEIPLLVAVNMAQEGVGLAAALFLGDTVRSRRALDRETKARLALLETEQQMEAERRVIDERMEIARELHDVVAHTVTVIGVQANLAADAFDDSPEEARAAVESVQFATREAMSELRSAVAVIRQGESVPLVPTPGLDRLGELMEGARAAGLSVDLHLDDSPGVPTVVQLAAYRVIQEAMTNVLRHSKADHVEVTVARDSDRLRITILDNGEGAADIDPPGHGIAGMKERVVALGGALVTGDIPGGGFRVEAEIPIEGAP